MQKRSNFHEFTSSIPTLFISECVLIYTEPSVSEEIIKLSSLYKPSLFVIYEQIKPNDSFGKMMIKNLVQRKCPLLSIEKYPTTDSQQKLFIDRGFEIAMARDVYQVYQNFVNRTEKTRIEKIEIFDEYEEWKMILEHYCFVIASNMGDDMKKSKWISTWFE
jgi:tRNA wybutosine-synthesizing protein 4